MNRKLHIWSPVLLLFGLISCSKPMDNMLQVPAKALEKANQLQGQLTLQDQMRKQALEESEK